MIPTEYIYVIGSDVNGPVKLGISGDPARRLTKLQTGHPYRLYLYHVEPIESNDGESNAGLFERLLHRDVRYLRTVGEWFNLTAEQAIKHVQFTIIQYGSVPNLAEKIRLRRI